MCVQLSQNGQIIIPGHRVLTSQGTMTWGKDLGFGLVYNARLESVEKGVWRRYKFNKVADITVDGFYEKGILFMFPRPTKIGLIHDGKNFMVVTESASPQIRKVHDRQPCFLQLIYLKNLAA